jgi:hypothetical protein
MDVMLLNIYLTCTNIRMNCTIFVVIIGTLHKYRVFAQHLLEIAHSFDKIDDIMDIVYDD